MLCLDLPYHMHGFPFQTLPPPGETHGERQPIAIGDVVYRPQG